MFYQMQYMMNSKVCSQCELQEVWRWPYLYLYSTYLLSCNLAFYELLKANDAYLHLCTFNSLRPSDAYVRQ